jgi:hypothetical protein
MSAYLLATLSKSWLIILMDVTLPLTTYTLRTGLPKMRNVERKNLLYSKLTSLGEYC